MSPETVTDVSEGFSSAGSGDIMHEGGEGHHQLVNEADEDEDAQREGEEDDRLPTAGEEENMAAEITIEKSSFSFVQQDNKTESIGPKFPGLLFMK